MKNLKLWMGLALGCVLVGQACAELADKNKPIVLTADQGTLDQKTNTTTWWGNVIVTQGTMTINAHSVIANKDANGNQVIVAKGSPATFRQKVEGKNEYITGRGDKVDYSSATGMAVLTGNAFVQQGQDSVKGNVITYNTNTQIFEAKGGNAAATGPNKGRVTVVIQPQQEQDKK